MTAGAEISGLHKSFQLNGRALPVLAGLDFTQRDGITVVLGASGCGKTTLLRLVAGMEKPDTGTVRVTGRIGMVFQEPRLMPWLTTAQNISFGRRAARADVARLVELTGLAGFEDALPHQLSGGMQQRVALGRALANRPALVLMDEPFAALDHVTRERMQDELLTLQRTEGLNVLFVTHSIDEALYVGDRVVVLADGRIHADHDLTQRPGPRSRELDPELAQTIRSHHPRDRPLGHPFAHPEGHTMLKKTLAFVATAAIGTAALVGCTTPARQSADPAPTTTPEVHAVAEPTVDSVALTYVTSPLNVPSIAERQLGTFTDAFGKLGVDVTYSELTTGPEQTAALASGDIQFLFAVGATSVILAAANGADIAIVDMYSRSPEAFMLITAAGGPMTPADLVGKTVAGPKGTILHELLLAYLASGGFTADDVTFVDMKLPDAQAALAGGSIDVALLAGPLAATMLADGFQKVTDGVGLVGATIVVATTREFADANPSLVETFRAAHKDVLAYMTANEDEVLGMAATETGLPAESVKAMYGMYDFSADVTDADVAAMEKTQEFMVANGMIEKPVDIAGLILPTS